MKLRRRGFIATLAALVAGGKAVAAAEPEPAPPEPTDKWLAPGPRSNHWWVTDDSVVQFVDPADDVRLGMRIVGQSTTDLDGAGGDCVIRGGNGNGTDYAGAPVHISGSMYLDPATDGLLYSDGGRWTPIVAGATKD
jgi:hypothetical protein